MSYEEIDRSIYGTDVFTNGSSSRYAKPKLQSTNDADDTAGKTGEKKKRSSKNTSSTVDESADRSHENGQTEEPVKTKKKTRKTHENEEETAQATPPVDDSEVVVKPKKKRAPKIESNNENIDPVPVEEEPVKKKKSKAPKIAPVDGDVQIIDDATINELDPSVEATPKVKKTKKHKAPKVPTDTLDETQFNNSNEYSTNQEFDGTYGASTGDTSYDIPPAYPTEGEQMTDNAEMSEYEKAIRDAYDKLALQMNFAQYVGDDKWCVIHLPKTARTEPKSRIRKILPGGKDEKSNKPVGEKVGFFKRFSHSVNTLVRDENNIIFGNRLAPQYAYYDEEEEGVDTDDLHRYAQKLRELEDTDREVNPEFLVLRDGKTVYGVHEADADGKMTLSTRKPIYDRFGDQKPEDEPEKKKLLSRLKLPFARNKDKDGKGSSSPKSAGGTPDPNGKRSRKANKHADDGVASSEAFLD